MLQLLRSNPGLIVSMALMAGGTLVSLLMAFIMARSGASLRPILWFAGFFALIVVPQTGIHLWTALAHQRASAPRFAALENFAGSDPQARSAAAKLLFGPDADESLVTDARKLFGDPFGNAAHAAFASLPAGESVLLARFNGWTDAEKAWSGYLQVSGLARLDGKGDSQRGYAVTRPAGDRAYALHMGDMVGVWTGPADAAIRKRMAAGGFETPRRAPLAPAAVAKPAGPVSPMPGVPAIAAALAVYLLLVVLYFFKGASWAGSHPPQPGVAAIPAEDLAGRLEAINALDVPFRIERGPLPNEFFATWRYADAKWIDLARARGMRRTFRIRLTLDEAAGVVRATDYTASCDWSAGRGGADLDWKSSVGIVFFQYEHQRVFGLQLDERGHFKPELSHAWTFDLKELKSPLVDAVTRAGWTWRPTLLQGPAWLRWLTG